MLLFFVRLSLDRFMFQYYFCKNMKLLCILVGMLLFSSSCSSASTQADKIVRVTAEGTSEELSSMISALEIEDVSTIQFGRNYSLTHAAIANKLNPEVINILYKFGGDINAQDDDLRTPLDHAINNDNSKAARILLELGADPTIENNAGVNVLDTCRNVALRNMPNHSACNTVINFIGR